MLNLDDDSLTYNAHFQDGSMIHSVRTYTLDENNVVHNLIVIGIAEFQPFQALAESHHIFVK